MVGNRIGEILVELGYLTPDRLAQTIHAGNGDDLRTGERLCRLGLIREEDLVHALAIQSGIPHVDLGTVEVGQEALRCLPPDLAQRYRALPLSMAEGRIHLAMADPFNLRAVEDISAVCGLEVVRHFARPSELLDALRRYYGTSAARMADSLANGSTDAEAVEGGDLVGHLHELAREPSLINLVNLIILEAVQDKASDIHIEPFERELKVKYRIDGVLHEMAPPSKHLQAAIISRIKIMAQLNIAERFLPQDGHIKFNAPSASVDIRVSTVPTMFGESVVMRILDRTATMRQLGELGLGDDLLAAFGATLRRPHGIILVTGPTGSGKTTTLYAALNHIYTPAKKIITIEDPVEFHLEGVNQIQVNVKRGLTFANGLRSILRQDPDIVMVGEIRDGETADIAIRSALTGHLVLSSLHTNDSAGAITRLLDMGIEPFLLATTVEAVIAQRLVRVVCDRCDEVYQPAARTLEQLGGDAVTFGGKELHRGRGCQDCRNTGYRGRIGIFEMIRLTDAVREMLMNRPSSSQIRRAANHNFTSMRQDGYRKVLDGVTTLEEVWRVTQDAQQENGTPVPA
ncbi:MAG TPA: ATPase, T2SS/T4P/T4SS family [Phycisphaerae bacterium]|nr:ATPase, T2SS/T4P/T4SS family [Phycisphaerae bacterium]HRY69670.1 ATPase, T2SS/T4P/T4SS family [Phycisphaerae bacterium]HSA25133.1 ATPase, T2SS/T4P/T4SS family [Phycisphaerae bacterium]